MRRRGGGEGEVFNGWCMSGVWGGLAIYIDACFVRDNEPIHSWTAYR
jgi:hypothetical protein